MRENKDREPQQVPGQKNTQEPQQVSKEQEQTSPERSASDDDDTEGYVEMESGLGINE